MFDLGLQELVVIFLVALLVFGPNKLPEVARTFGKWFAEIRNGIYNAKMQMDKELSDMEEKPKDDSDMLTHQENKPEETSGPKEKS
jgi:Tat protein translocase TatB subunit